MAILDALKQGMNLMVTFVSLFGALYVALFIILIIVGVIANVAKSGDINVSSQSQTAINDTEDTFTNAVDTLQDPVTVILSLVVVGVLTAMFFPQGIFASQGGGRQKGGVL